MVNQTNAKDYYDNRQHFNTNVLKKYNQFYELTNMFRENILQQHLVHHSRHAGLIFFSRQLPLPSIVKAVHVLRLHTKIRQNKNKILCCIE